LMELDKDKIAVLTNKAGEQLIRDFTISNVNGQAPLEYSLNIDYARSGNLNPADIQTTATVGGNMPKLLSTGNKIPVARMKVEGYNNVLEYDTLSDNSTRIGFGEGFAFSTATAFTAPANGFNLTHLMTWYVPFQTLDSKIVVEIRVGSEIKTSKVLTTEEWHSVIENEDQGGKYLTYELQNPQIIYPNEKFFVIFKYPFTSDYPQGSAFIGGTNRNKFFYGSDGEWNDLSETSYYEYGWMVKALEKSHEDGEWVSLDNSGGTIAEGNQKTVHVTFSSGIAFSGNSYAKAVIESNDPVNNKAGVSLYLRKNQGPEFYSVPAEPTTISENEVGNYQFAARDLEADAFEYTLAGNSSNTSLTVTDGIASLQYNPDYESAGSHTFEVVATDSNGFKTSSFFNLEVLDVNRIPEVNAQPDYAYWIGHQFVSLPVSSLVIDPDGDQLWIQASSNNPDVADVAVAKSQLVLILNSVDTTTINITAMDNKGGEVQFSFKLDVTAILGIEDVKEQPELFLYPNPVSSKAHLVVKNTGYGRASIFVNDLSGRTLSILQTEMDGQGSKELEFDASALRPGLYFIELRRDGKPVSTLRFIKTE
jgi:hypothetical protein